MRIANVRICGDPSQAVRTFARRTSSENSSSPELVDADTFLLGPAGEVLVEVRGLVLQRAGRPARAEQQLVSDWLYDVQWEPSPLPADTNVTLAGQHVVIFADSRGVADSLIPKLVGWRGFRDLREGRQGMSS